MDANALTAATLATRLRVAGHAAEVVAEDPRAVSVAGGLLRVSQAGTRVRVARPVPAEVEAQCQSQ